MRLKELREKLGFTQKMMAETVGCQQKAYQRYESGEREPSFELLIKMADTFGVSVDYLIGRENPDPLILSAYETDLLTTARAADKRAKEDALTLLKAHVK